MANTHANRAADDEPQTYVRLAPGTELLVDQTAELVARILPHIGSIAATAATYEYHRGMCRVNDHGRRLEIPAHVLLRIERDQTLQGGGGLLPVWTWRDKRRMVTALRADTGEPMGVAEVRYTDANDTTHTPTFRTDSVTRQAFLDESAEVSAAIARRTVAMLRTMIQALDRSPLNSAEKIRGEFAILTLRDADLRSEAVAQQLALVNPDLALDSREPRRLTLGIEQLQRMLAFAEQVVFQESEVVALAIREAFAEVQGKRQIGWRRWVPGTASATYARGSEEPEIIELPVLVYHDRDHRALLVSEPAPRRMPSKGDLIEGWTVRSFDCARLLTESESIAVALRDEWDERHRSMTEKVTGAVSKLQRLRR